MNKYFISMFIILSNSTSYQKVYFINLFTQNDSWVFYIMLIGFKQYFLHV